MMVRRGRGRNSAYPNNSLAPVGLTFPNRTIVILHSITWSLIHSIEEIHRTEVVESH